LARGEPEIIVKPAVSNTIFAVLSVAALIFSLDTEVFAHGGGNWNPFRIDRVNNDAQARVLQFQQEISDLIRGRSEAIDWPVPDLQRMRDELISVKEEVDEILEHYVTDGANLQLAQNLRAEPRMGRTAAASRSLDASISLISHAATLEDRDAFVKEFYSRGLAAYLYELLEAHKDRMDLYGELMAVVEQPDETEE
jgi:hypothetical protein